VTGLERWKAAPFFYAQDFTVMGGALGEMHGKKIAHVRIWPRLPAARSSE
jgi:acetyl-CoA carboxylase carboxyltransferase component